MRRFFTYVVAVAVVGVAVVSAQKPVTSVEELDAAMKRLGQANQAVGKAVKSGDFAGARTSYGNVKQALTDAQAFWAMHKKADAVKMTQDAIAAITGVEAMLSAAAPDQVAIQAAMKQQVGASCTACHKQYRLSDEAQPPTYTLKPGSI
jgi:cytochrome c556